MFDVKAFVENFSGQEIYTGSNFSYVVFAKKGDSKLAINIEPAEVIAPYKGEPTPVAGYALRLIEIGNDNVFGKAFGSRSARHFKGPDGKAAMGFALSKEFLALTNMPCSGVQYQEYASKSYPKLVAWLKDKIISVGGEMVLSEDVLLATLDSSISKVETASLDLFHLPGVKPDWLKPDSNKPAPAGLTKGKDIKPEVGPEDNSADEDPDETDPDSDD